MSQIKLTERQLEYGIFRGSTTLDSHTILESGLLGKSRKHFIDTVTGKCF